VSAPQAERQPDTPAAQWRENGEKDPHGTRYNCERAELALGKLSDDELANGAFMNYDTRMSVEDMMNPKPGQHMPIVWMTAVKDRIRWLSRRLVEAQAERQEGAGAGADDAHLFELWWAEFMPEATQARAWAAWVAAPRADGVGVAAPPAAPVAAMREAFEAEWARLYPHTPDPENPPQFDRQRNGDYVFSSVQDAWRGWSAALAAPQQVAPQVRTDEQKRASELVKEWHEGARDGSLIEWGQRAVDLLWHFYRQPAPPAQQVAQPARMP
jgi:hypothetical protein